MVREQQVLDLIGRIYDAALDASYWPAVLQDLVRLTHSNTGNLAEFDLATGSTRPIAAIDMPAKGFSDYETYYWQQDIWTPKPGTFEVGRAYSSQHTIDNHVLLRSGFYHDWMRPMRLFYGMGGIPLVEGRKMLLIGVHRPWPRQRAYGDQDVGLLQQLFPHFKRALQIRHRLEEAASERGAFADAVDHLPRGVFAFDSNGRLLWTNRAGHDICRKADGFAIRKGALTTNLPVENQCLQQLIRQTIVPDNDTGLSCSDTMLVSRPSGLRQYIVLVSPLSAGRRPRNDRHPAAIVFVTDPDRTPEVSMDQLQRLYGLTPAEAQLALHLAVGLSLKDIAERSRRTMNTVRSQLKQVLHKTGTSRQAQLVRLVLQA